MWEAATLLAVFGILVTAGLLFVNQSLYKDFEGKDPVVQVRTCSNDTLTGSSSTRLKI